MTRRELSDSEAARVRLITGRRLRRVLYPRDFEVNAPSDMHFLLELIETLCSPQGTPDTPQ